MRIPRDNKAEVHYSRIRKKIFSGLLLVPVVPFLMVLGLGYCFYYSALEKHAQAALAVLTVFVAGGMLIATLGVLVSGRLVDMLRNQDREKERLEQQLVMAARMAELGEMATGFAHEINNPLQVMKSDLALASLIMRDLERDENQDKGKDLAELSESLEQIQIQIDRCAAITSEVLKFGRHGESARQDIDPGEFVPMVAAMVERKAQVSGIDFNVKVAPGTPRVYADPGELQQVLLNLLNNAIHAIAERHGCEGGRLELTAGAGEGGALSLAVKDNGMGISRANLERVFTPFFTTKPPGKGTGLGLSVCFGIIERLGGTMEVRSEPGQGALFTVEIPHSA